MRIDNRCLMVIGGFIAALVAGAPAAVGQQLFVYPANGQSDEQLANDRYECHRWAVKETNFDPTDFGDTAPPPVVRVPVPENKAAGATAKGAVAGAIAGAVLGHGGDKAKDVVTGAIAGSIAGAAVEQSGELKAQQEAQDEARRQAEEVAKSKAEKALRRSDYRRAITACLEGRGYTVR
jgi:outer membrane lipoprotein SlyB